ncbi:MAG: hypothetical protein RIF41_03485 [Polyangiaceae bacterium]
MAHAYATRDDVFNLALSAQAFVVRARNFEDIDVATGVIRLKAHGFGDEDLVTLEVTGGGSLPTGLSAHVAYGVDPVSFDLFRLTSSGSPITSYASGGSGWSVALDTMRRLDKHLEAAAARIDQSLTAHRAPLTAPYPVHVVEINARMAARRMLTSLEFNNAAFRVSTERLIAMGDEDEAQLARWRAGQPIYPTPVDQTPETSDDGAFAVSGRAAVCWTTGRL